MFSPKVRALVESALAGIGTALGFPGAVVPILVDVFEALTGATDVQSAAERLKQNALADAEDAAAEGAADLLLRKAPHS